MVAFAQVMRMFNSGIVYPHCAGIKSVCEWGCSGCLDKTEKRALRNKAFLSCPLMNAMYFG